MVFEKQIVLRTNRLIRARNVKCFRSIFWVFRFPGLCTSGSRCAKPRQNIVYLSAELNRLCWMRVSTDISIRDLSSVGGLIVPLYSVVAHRNATLWVQSI